MRALTGDGTEQTGHLVLASPGHQLLHDRHEHGPRRRGHVRWKKVPQLQSAPETIKSEPT